MQLRWKIVLLALALLKYTDCRSSLGGALAKLYIPAGPYVNLFVNLTFNCDTEISKVAYHTSAVSNFFVGIWEQFPNSTLVIRNKFEVLHSGAINTINSFRLETPVSVKKGQFLGIHTTRNYQLGFLSYTENDSLPSYPWPRHLLHLEERGRVCNPYIFDGRLKVGRHFNFTVRFDYRRLPSLRVYTTKCHKGNVEQIMSEKLQDNKLPARPSIANLTVSRSACALHCLRMPTCFSIGVPFSGNAECYLYDISTEEVPLVNFTTMAGWRFYAITLDNDKE